MDPLDPANARTAIENIMFSYAERIDGGDFDGLAELFSRARMVGPDGSVQGEGKEGVRAIYDRSTQLYEDGTPMTQHVTTNLIFEFAPDGRSAAVRSRFTVMQQLPDFPLQCIITGYYEDQFAYDEAVGWHFRERRMKPKLAGDLSRHLKYDLTDA
ncbi:MAG: nuclear transport factor 2 family protein [bacterium]|nr:hypothetical protein [Deltaproteobacteria bacterium]MCP4904540.1 nuclear transport factor 2 family protein [bacterium]